MAFPPTSGVDHDHRRPRRRPRRDQPTRRSPSSTATARATTTRCRSCSRAARACGCATRGRRYLDMMSAYSAVSFGHGDPVARAGAGRAGAAARRHVARFHTDRSAPSSRGSAEVTGLGQALPMNTGAEAVETAIKAARKWAYKVKGVPRGHGARSSCAAGNFAGRTTTIVGFSSEAQYRDGFGPFARRLRQRSVRRRRRARSGDHAEHRRVHRRAGAGRGRHHRAAGAATSPRCAEICTRRNVLLICDEVQTGLGRTGRILRLPARRHQPDGHHARQGARRRLPAGVGVRRDARE